MTSMPLRLFSNCSFAVGLGLAVSCWNVRAGIAVGIASTFVGITVAQYGIGPRRFGALVITAAFGNICRPLAEAAIDASEEGRVDESRDWIAKWIRTAWNWNPPRLIVSLVLLAIGVGIGTAIAAVEYALTKAGNVGILLPVEGSTAPLDVQAHCLGLASVTVVSSILLSVYSIAIRRAVIVAASIGCCFGTIVGISLGDLTGYAVVFGLVGVSMSIAGALLVMWTDRHDKNSESGSDVSAERSC